MKTIRNAQRGAAMIVTLILVTALIAGGALAMYLELADTKSAPNSAATLVTWHSRQERRLQQSA